MSPNLFRKRHVPPLNDARSNRGGATTVPLLNGRQVKSLQKGFLRRTRLLFSLLRHYPVVVLILFFTLWTAFRFLSHKSRTLQPDSNSQFHREVAKTSHPLFLDEHLVDSFDEGQIQRLSNLRDTPHGVFMDVLLKGAQKGIIKVYTQETSPTSSHMEHARQPQLHLLAKLLNLSQGFVPSCRIRLPIVLRQPVADRHLTKALCHICGFRSPTKVPEGATVPAHVIPVEAGALRFLSALRMPTIEPYEWVSNLPTSDECNRITQDEMNHMTERNRCRRLTEVMIVMYLAGCAPPGNDAFVQVDDDVSEDGNMFKLAFPWGCFERYRDNSVLLDIVMAFIGKTCSLPSELLGLINRLVGVGWGVSKRAEILEKRLFLLNDDHDSLCRIRGWTFYGGSIEQ